MGLFSKKKKTVIVVESSTEKTESTARKDNALEDVVPKNVGKLDMVIAFDTTGSMAQYIGAVRKEVSELVPQLFKDNDDLRLGIVAFGAPLEIRNDGDAYMYVADQWVYPRIKVTDTIKRNGFKGSCHHIHPVTLFQQLLSNPKAETLMKSNDIELLRYLCHNTEEVDKYWNTIKIAKRNGYKVTDTKTWFDYIKMLERMGRDINSPSLIAPKDLKHAHDEYVEKVNRQRRK